MLYRSNFTDHRADPLRFPVHAIQGVDRQQALDRGVSHFFADLQADTFLQNHYCLTHNSCIGNAQGHHQDVHMGGSTRYAEIVEVLCAVHDLPQVWKAWQGLCWTKNSKIMMHWLVYSATPAVLQHGIPEYNKGGGTPQSGSALSHNW